MDDKKPCSWCDNTSGTIDSLEYQLEMMAEEMLDKLERIDELRETVSGLNNMLAWRMKNES